MVLKNLNLIISKGETVGLIGSSGSGKTTIADLIIRLFNPTGGKIIMDETDISEINLKNWRNNIGYVSQDIFLLNDTIENNIKFYSDLSEEEVIKAAKLANIYDFIMEQPKKFDSLVGERGLKLSAGQRQRIILARVIARKPQILILDEATSALDNESESLIQQALENLHGKITILMIAHRLSTVMNADKLFVLENGEIIEEGVPRVLLENKGSEFSKIYNAGDKTK
jgi:ABC-type multidrug transport system fused ATPase/permease subunit